MRRRNSRLLSLPNSRTFSFPCRLDQLRPLLLLLNNCPILLPHSSHPSRQLPGLLLAPNSKDDLEEIRRGEEAHRLDDLDPSEVTTKNVCESVPNGVHGEIDLLVRPPVKKIVNDDDGSLDVLHEAAPKVKKGSAAPEGDGLQTRPRIVGEFNVGKGFFRKHGGGGTVDVEVRRVEQVEEDGEFEGCSTDKGSVW